MIYVNNGNKLWFLLLQVNSTISGKINCLLFNTIGNKQITN